MSITPRASGFWQDSTRMSYFDGDEEADVLLEEGPVYPEADGRSALDRTIDRIGMGSYQWTLLSLCGFGWMADNMWIQAIAIILPRVQQHYSVPDSYIGTVSSSMFAGMMLGAIGWGTCSDLMGRSTAFNATLFFTSVFGLLASFANSFLMLCIFLFLLGSAVGGSMPTDGTLLLEHMPKGKQYLVTALSVFFSFGAVLAAIVALLIVPKHSCSSPYPSPCDPATENQGWRYMLISLGIITLSMFLARMVFFRLHESPRYLVHAGRPQEALESLQMISRFNGSEIELDIEDVDDRKRPPSSSPVPADIDSARTPFLSSADVVRGRPAIPDFDNNTGAVIDADGARKDYCATGESPNSLDTHSFTTPVLENAPVSLSATFGTHRDAYANPTPDQALFCDVLGPAALSPKPPNTRPTATPSSSAPRRPRLGSHVSRRRSSSLHEMKSKGQRAFFRWIQKPLWQWLDRIAMVLTPEWLRTTVLMWTAWCTMSLAYTMFNVFLPKLLETRGEPDGTGVPKSLESSLWDVVIFTIGGCPGAILGAYLVETPLGRRWSLAGSTFVTALFCIMFVLVESAVAVRASTVGISLSATTMWAVLYGWTPEIFDTKVRGTACGIASALSRIGGMIAPLLGGTLLTINRSFPVYTSVVIFVVAGMCVLLLRENEGGHSDEGVAIVH